MRILGSAITQLFDVEAGLRCNSGRAVALREQTVTAKARLSFLSMGLPAWLASPQADPKDISRHRGWLYQVGEFLGWIDDLADIEEDMALGFGNRIVMRLRRPNARCSRTLNSLTKEIAVLGSKITDHWMHRVSMTETYGKSLNSFKTNVFLWIGGRGYLSI
jgi:hypothetical protein